MHRANRWGTHGSLLAVLVVLALAGGAQAAPTNCLTSTWTLEDQRALAALRTATEAACPCATFTRRGTYQRCARAAIETAIGATALRADCRSTARAIAKGSTCGTSKVACGQVRADDESYECKLRRAEACHDTNRFARTGCTAQTHCADVVDWTAGTCLDPRAFGPYAPGYRVIQYTKDSVTSPGTPRVLDTSIWYPAPAGSGPIAPDTGGVANAPLDASGGPYPLVLFSHGSCGFPLQSKFLTPLLASWGFVVVAPPHPGNTISRMLLRRARASLTAVMTLVKAF